MKYHFVAAALAAQVSVSAAFDYAAATDCTALDNQCRVGPDANMATCAAAKAACAACEDKDSQCRVGADANMATCSAEKVACVAAAYPQLQSTTAAPSATPTAVVQGGKTVYQTEEVTITSCGPEVTNCPARSHSATAPPASATTPAGQSCQDKENACRTKPDANMAQCSAERAACDGYIPGQPTTTGSTSGGQSCEDKENACRTAPGANQSKCSADRAACDGYVPGQSSGTTLVPAKPTGSTSGGQSCQEKENACRTAPGANMSKCSADRAACDGYVPTRPSNGTASVGISTPTPVSTPPATYTGAASAVSFSVMALGAAAAAFFM